jgi:hypothetical protein
MRKSLDAALGRASIMMEALDPTDQQRSWPVSEQDPNGHSLGHDGELAECPGLDQEPTGKNLENLNMHWHEKSLPPTGARRSLRMELEYQDRHWQWARLQVCHTRCSDLTRHQLRVLTSILQ